MDDTYTDSQRPICSNDDFSQGQCSYHITYVETPSPYNNRAWDEHPTANQAPLSLFAQTMLEQDREFYAHFPAAKQAAAEQWGYYQASFDGTGFQYGEEISSCFVEPQCPPPQYSVQPEHSIESPHVHITSVNVPQVIDDCPMTPPLESGLNYDYGVPLVQSAASSPAESTQCEWTESEVPHHVLQPVEDFQEELPPTAPSSPILEVEDRFLVPSQQPQLEISASQPPRRRRGRPRSLGYIPSPNSKFITSSSSDFISSSPSNSTFSVQLTGHWSTDAQALSEVPLHAPAPRHARMPDVISLEQPDVETPSTRRYPLTYRLRRSRSHPYAKGGSSPSSRARVRTPKHRTKQLPGDSKKPLLACLFCRGRKIACGSPMYGNAEETCDQCEKRHLVCKYPTESRRGVRKKKDSEVEEESSV